jgi:hypothetical protein
MKFSSLQRENLVNKPRGQKKKKKPNLGTFTRPLEDEVHLFGRLIFC